jgi:hypothetical protein
MIDPSRRILAALLAALVLSAAPASGQVTTVYLPDANAGSGVVCNMIPFSPVFGNPAGAWTQLTIVPASMLASQGVPPGHRLVDVRFAPCGSGLVQINDVQILAGHLVSPLPTFSLADGFSDAVVVHDSGASGPLAFACTANTWSSLGVGGGGFVWNGLADVGIYSTHGGVAISSTTGWQGSFWRESALMRHYVNAYQATSALTSSLNALKTSLVFADPAATPASVTGYGPATPGALGVPHCVVAESPAFGNAAFGVGLWQAWPGATAVLLVSSSTANVAIGLSSDVRLLVDLTPGATPLLFAIAASAGGSAWLPAPIPAWDPALAGFTAHCQWAIVGDPGGQPTVLGVPLAMTAGVSITVGF